MSYRAYFYKSSSRREVVLEFIGNLDMKTQERIRNALTALKQYGLTLLSTPFVKKVHKIPPIFELRIINNPQVRILFCQQGERVFVMCHIFVKKTKKIPKREIDTAIKRARQFIY